jgi:hypothetical protein
MKAPEVPQSLQGFSAGFALVEGLEEVPWLAVQAVADALGSPWWWNNMTDMHELLNRDASLYRYAVYSQVGYRLP